MSSEQTVVFARIGVDNRRPNRRRLTLVIVLAAVAALLLAAAGGTAVYAYAGDVPRGTVVLGVPLGGLSRTDATNELERALGTREAELAQAVPVLVGDQATTIQPADVALAVDVDATIARATKGSPKLWGTRVVDPVITVDPERLDKALEPTAAKVAQAITKPAITFAGLTPKATHPKPGKGLDKQRSAEAVVAGWLRTPQVVVPVVEIQPRTSAADVDRLLSELATPAVAAPVTVTVTKPGSTETKGTLTIPPAAIAKSLILAGDEHGLITPTIDGNKLRAALGTSLSKLETQPKDARITKSGSAAPIIVASTGGEVLDLKRFAEELLAVLPQPDPRTMTAALTAVEAETTAEDMAQLGIKEQVSTFTTYFTGGMASPRSQNIATIAREVDGAVVKPGETFSLNGHTGPRGYAEGYKDAPVIVGGQLSPGVGGGVSQFTTTLFNAAYYAGLEDVHHMPHSYYFSRYPAVIESTIFYPTLDMKFRNDSSHGVLIDTSTTDNSVTVSLWSTKRYDISTVWSARRDPTSPKTVYIKPGPQCVATEGLPGFTQDAWRIFKQNGKEIKREKFTWRYDPEPRQVCGSPPNPSPTRP